MFFYKSCSEGFLYLRKSFEAMLAPVVFVFLLTLSEGQGSHKSVSQLLWAHITYPTLSTFPVGENPSTWRKTSVFDSALTCEGRVRVGLINQLPK